MTVSVIGSFFLPPPRGEMQSQGAAHTHCQPYLFILVGQAIVVIEVKPPSRFPVTEQILFQTKQHTEVAFTADQPNWVLGGLQVTTNLEEKQKILERHRGWGEKQFIEENIEFIRSFIYCSLQTLMKAH